ncbi:MAG: hypothetical protein JXJ17_17010 [Anaerolineae bacterium]|nr:hypothetical protein [Anaerolineae bacterium]
MVNFILTLFFAIVFSLIIGLISGVYPALRAVHLDPVRGAQIRVALPVPVGTDRGN